MFGYTRLMVAAFGLGAGWAALDRAIPYSTKRIQAGAPLSEKQGYTHKLIVPNVARLEAGRAYIEQTAERIDAGEGKLNTEGAIAKYMSTEAGNPAADASIQALGGYGYTHEYMVEKISRDVRITTIYEGTSEIMEMTISRDRWQLHLKTRGQHYHERAREFEVLHAKHPTVGADIAALALHALAEVMEKARIGRLTRYQHILLRMGEWIAYAEAPPPWRVVRRSWPKAGSTKRPTGASTRRPGGNQPDLRPRGRAQGAPKKVCAGSAAPVASPTPRRASLSQRLEFSAIHRAQAGLISDMDLVADVLYGRAAKPALAA